MGFTSAPLAISPSVVATLTIAPKWRPRPLVKGVAVNPMIEVESGSPFSQSSVDL